MPERFPNLKAVAEGKSFPRFRMADIEEKIEAASNILLRCEFCSHLCEIDRTQGELGLCRVEDHRLVTSIAEKSELLPYLTPGFAVAFVGNTLDETIWSDWETQRKEAAEEASEIEASDLASQIEKQSGCKSLNFGVGEPSPHIPFIVDLLSQLKADLPIVYNSNFYMSHRSMSLLLGLVDLYVADFKFGSERCAERQTGVHNYLSAVKDNLVTARQDAELLIRHLVVPNHIDCCTKPILEFIADKFGESVAVNLIGEYNPLFDHQESVSAKAIIDKNEYDAVIEYANQLGLDLIV